MAAIDTIFKLLSPGDHIIAANDVYGGTFRLADKVWSRYGLHFSWVDTADVDAVRAAIRPETKLIWLETPTNPRMLLADIAAIAQVAREAHDQNILVVVDNTFASPALQQPLTLGAHIVMHSATKYLGGHSDVVGGAIMMRDESLFRQLKFLQNAAGAVPGPFDCFLILRGLKTLPLRMERHSANGLQVARFLEDHRQTSDARFWRHVEPHLARWRGCWQALCFADALIRAGRELRRRRKFDRASVQHDARQHREQRSGG